MSMVDAVGWLDDGLDIYGRERIRLTWWRRSSRSYDLHLILSQVDIYGEWNGWSMEKIH